MQESIHKEMKKRLAVAIVYTVANLLLIIFYNHYAIWAFLTSELGVLSNMICVLSNGGKMPVAGIERTDKFYSILTTSSRFKLLSDRIVINISTRCLIMSIGDVIILLSLFILVFEISRGV